MTRALESATAKPAIEGDLGEGTVFVVFPEWCAQCRAMMKTMTEFARVNASTPLRAYGLMFAEEGEGRAGAAREAMDKELQGTQTFVVPAETAKTLGALDFPTAVVVDGPGNDPVHRHDSNGCVQRQRVHGEGVPADGGGGGQGGGGQVKACAQVMELSMKSAFLVFVILCAAISAESQTEPKAGGAAPSLAAVSSQSAPGGQGASRADSVINAAQYPSIQAAIDAIASSGGEVWIPCGTYVGNITITTSNLWLHGAGWQCVNLLPSADGDMVVLDATNAGANGINFDRIDGLMLSNHKGWNGSGLVLKGGADQPNDWHKFDSMVIAGF